MYEMSDKAEQMIDDERVLVRRRDMTLGGNTVVVDGTRVHRGYEAEFAILCTVQPVSGKERMDLPEGHRFDEQYFLYADDSEQPTQVDDLIFRPAENLWYVVRDAEGHGSYTRLRIQLQDVGHMNDDGEDALAAFDKQQFVSRQPNG